MKVDITHPDYKQYAKEYTAILLEFSEVEKAKKAKYPKWRGFDHPAGREIKRIWRTEYKPRLDELNEKYAYLFTIE